MGMLCAVSFNRYGRLYYLDPGDLHPQVGDKVLVPTDDGPEVAECVWAAQWVTDDTDGFPKLAGMAGEGDLRRDETLRRRKAEAKVAAKRLIREHGLPMKVVAVDHVFAVGEGNSDRTTVFFTAPHRVDFRSLVRDLGATLHCRVELRQLSARDSARVQGGIGSCGRDLCCATFLTDFEPVTIRMAKDQDLPLNPMRISGACGRLMCCLKFEHPLYQKFQESAPPVGTRVTTAQGDGKVVGHSVPRDAVTVRLDADGSRSVCSRADVCGPRRAHDSRDQSAPRPADRPVTDQSAPRPVAR
ncbi:PSP1 domain-containing protein [Micromonospora sp. SH-82]|uniref:PSP1 domain-containing protein n=1 Tax=Micromonospora sp. SH-82 TaxID=3132938 RepID=UPI003EB9C9EF